MIIDIMIGLLAVYGVYFYLQGKQQIAPEVRKTLPPQDIEDYTQEKNQQKYIGQIILCLVAIYMMFILV